MVYYVGHTNRDNGVGHGFKSSTRSSCIDVHMYAYNNDLLLLLFKAYCVAMVGKDEILFGERKVSHLAMSNNINCRNRETNVCVYRRTMALHGFTD